MTILEALRKLNLNEDLKDIDFKKLDELDKSVKSLQDEIKVLSKEYSNKISTKTKNQEIELKKKIDNLKSHIGYLYDSCEDNDYFDIKKYNKVKGQISQASKELFQAQKELKTLSQTIKKEFEAEYNNIKNKKNARSVKLLRSEVIRDRIKNSYSELQPEIEEVIKVINKCTDEEWKADPKSLDYKDGKIQLRLFLKHDRGEDIDLNDIDFEYFDKDSTYVNDNYVDEQINEFIEEHIVDSQFIIEEYDFESVENDWYRIEDLPWMILYSEPEVEAIETPYFTNYYYDKGNFWEPRELSFDVDGNFILEASIYISKKI